VSQIVVQGRLISIATTRPLESKEGFAPTRGEVTGFSKRSRLRLMHLFATLSDAPAMFITLTYGQKYPTAAKAKTHLKSLFKRLQRENPDASMVWRIELQKRLAPHFHLILYGFKFISFKRLRAMWLEVIGHEYANTANGTIKCPSMKVIRMKGTRQVSAYVSKYVAKQEDAGTLDSEPYLAAQKEIGRHWGVMGSDKLPYAQKIIIELPDEEASHKIFYDFKRVMRRYWQGVNRYGNTGASIFSDNATDWLRYALVHLRITSIVDAPVLVLDACIFDL